MDERKAKGAVLKGYLKFVKKKWGTIGMEDAMKYAGIDVLPKDSDWLPVIKFDRTLEWIAENKKVESVREAGRHSAKDLGIFGYLFGALVGAEKLLGRARTTYPDMFNYGEMKADMGENRAVVNIKGTATSEYTCMAWEGGLIGLMEITRSDGRVKRVEPDGPMDCKFILEWD